MGNVLAQAFNREGTSALANELHDLLPGETVAVESINADDGQSVMIRGRQFAQLQSSPRAPTTS